MAAAAWENSGFEIEGWPAQRIGGRSTRNLLFQREDAPGGIPAVRRDREDTRSMPLHTGETQEIAHRAKMGVTKNDALAGCRSHQTDRCGSPSREGTRR